MINDPTFYIEDLKSKFAKLKDKSKYYLAYSGGKDSHMLLWFIKEILKDDEIEIVSCNTYMEHPEMLERMRQNCDVMIYPSLKPFEIKEKFGIPAFTKFQDEMISRYQRGSRTKCTMEAITGENRITFKLNKKAKELTLSGELHKVSPRCCDYLKKKPFKEYEKQSGRKAILGVRGSESLLRKNNYTSCFTKSGNFTPLHDLQSDLEMKIYQKYQIEIPSLYEHVSRSGCMGCPYGRNIELELSLLSPAQRKFVTEYFKESYEV